MRRLDTGPSRGLQSGTAVLCARCAEERTATFEPASNRLAFGRCSGFGALQDFVGAAEQMGVLSGL